MNVHNDQPNQEYQRWNGASVAYLMTLDGKVRIRRLSLRSKSSLLIDYPTVFIVADPIFVVVHLVHATFATFVLFGRSCSRKFPLANSGLTSLDSIFNVNKTQRKLDEHMNKHNIN